MQRSIEHQNSHPRKTGSVRRGAIRRGIQLLKTRPICRGDAVDRPHGEFVEGAKAKGFFVEAGFAALDRLFDHGRSDGIVLAAFLDQVIKDVFE